MRWSSDKLQVAIRGVYLHGAASLHPDLQGG
jgi:chorismate mutase